MSPCEFVCSRGHDTGIARFPLAGAYHGAEWKESVREALNSIASTKPKGGARLRVRLLPPLVEIRTARLPRLTATERRDVLGRNVDKYFALHGESVVVDSVLAGRPRRGDPFPRHVLVAAHTQTVSTIAELATEAGLSLESITAGPLDFAAATTAYIDGARSAIVGCAYSDRTELAAVCNGAIVAIRRLAHGRDDALAGSITQLSKEFGDQSKPIELFAIGDVEHPFACAKTAIDGHAASLIDLICGSDPVAVCASLPHGRQRASLLPPTLRAEHQRARWRKAARYAAAAAFALAIAFGARVYRIQDALAAERTQRARITAAVRESLALMDTMNALQREWRLVRDGDPKMRERWGTIAALSRMLPRGAWLRSIRLRGDTVFITGNALSAEEVFVALQRAPEFLSPRFTAPIDLETISGDDANEHFALRAGVSVGGDILQSGRTTRSKIGVSF